jgi:hypothetical protein
MNRRSAARDHHERGARDWWTLARKELRMIRRTTILSAVALLAAMTSAPAAQLGAAHDYARFAISSWPGTQAVSRCHRICVRTESHGPTAAPQCIKWEMIC